MGGQITNRVFRGNIHFSLNQIRGIYGYFVQMGLSSMCMGGRLKFGISQSTENLFF